jgi:hypothetical protein
MHQTRLCTIFVLVAASIAFSKGSQESSTVCDRYQQSDLIFTGSAENAWVTLLDTRKSPIHKRSEKSKRVRFLVREWYKGQRRDTVEVWMIPSACPLIMEANQTYLVYANVNKDNGHVESNACMGTIGVASAAADISYLTAAQAGQAQATRISGMAGGPGLNIVAKSGINTRYAVTDGANKFTFDGLSAGDWSLSVVNGPAKPVHLAPGSCVTVDLTTQ